MKLGRAFVGEMKCWERVGESRVLPRPGMSEGAWEGKSGGPASGKVGNLGTRRRRVRRLAGGGGGDPRQIR